jgi:hypothetical protein
MTPNGSAHSSKICFQNEREIVKTAPETLEFFEIIQLLDGVLSAGEKTLIKVAKHAGDYCAHMKPMGSLIAHRLSDHFELNRDLLEGDFPGLEGRTYRA